MNVYTSSAYTCPTYIIPPYSLTSQLEVRTSANLHCELGDCLVKLSRLSEAEEQFRLALGLVTLRTILASALFYFFILRLEKDHKRARKNLDTTNQLVSGHPAFSNFSDDGEYVSISEIKKMLKPIVVVKSFTKTKIVYSSVGVPLM